MRVGCLGGAVLAAMQGGTRGGKDLMMRSSSSVLLLCRHEGNKFLLVILAARPGFRAPACAPGLLNTLFSAFVCLPALLAPGHLPMPNIKSRAPIHAQVCLGL